MALGTKWPSWVEHSSWQVDEEQVRHAMADPEIQQILHVRDPVVWGAGV